jgi:hypothetical protein
LAVVPYPIGERVDHMSHDVHSTRGKESWSAGVSRHVTNLGARADNPARSSAGPRIPLRCLVCRLLPFSGNRQHATLAAENSPTTSVEIYMKANNNEANSAMWTCYCPPLAGVQVHRCFYICERKCEKLQPFNFQVSSIFILLPVFLSLSFPFAFTFLHFPSLFCSLSLTFWHPFSCFFHSLFTSFPKFTFKFRSLCHFVHFWHSLSFTFFHSLFTFFHCFSFLLINLQFISFLSLFAFTFVFTFSHFPCPSQSLFQIVAYFL